MLPLAPEPEVEPPAPGVVEPAPLEPEDPLLPLLEPEGFAPAGALVVEPPFAPLDDEPDGLPLDDEPELGGALLEEPPFPLPAEAAGLDYCCSTLASTFWTLISLRSLSSQFVRSVCCWFDRTEDCTWSLTSLNVRVRCGVRTANSTT